LLSDNLNFAFKAVAQMNKSVTGKHNVGNLFQTRKIPLGQKAVSFLDESPTFREHLFFYHQGKGVKVDR
jgi:hypothetical protein